MLQDILEAIGNIKDFTRGITFDMYLGDLKTKHAVERNFLIIGEAVARIDKPFRDKYPSVDWREVKDFRNIMEVNKLLFQKKGIKVETRS
ncbi:HepT-like ribonuclease domain-containing protein [Puia dinghuensis]|uniref:DUF86 domain-containing protein n=1 Tax=Puia dinghuensis TaxID=1792502 RepID=A0A8J2UEN7_9BACT|nr:HepT-like ribonuclease domain-containing protein [Puia dinghuensis]GGB05210.1 hypothetical protein GCM10011511_30690 [Puia dinghuensis]